MPDLTGTCLVSRTELAQPDLDIMLAPYSLWRNGISPGSVEKNKHRVSSIFVDGPVTVHSVKGEATLTTRVKVKGASVSAMWSAMDTLIAAFEQTEYTVTLTANGAQRSWLCEDASYSLGESGEIDSINLISYWQVITFVAERSPVALVGRI